MELEKAKDRPREYTACPEINGRHTSVESKSVVTLLEFDGCAGFFELLFDLGGFVFGRTFLNGFRSAFDEVFGFLEAEAGDGTDFLNDVDLLVASGGEDYVKLVFLSGSFASASGGSSSGNGYGSSGGNAPLLLESLDDVGNFENGLLGEPVDYLVFIDVAHDNDLLRLNSSFNLKHV